ncbi:hypothetical protein V1477_004998 [Vespula maculifrons]|uniref:Uncharacterized protein n=1 Tax=Vespula maculifrons TaxID=7453 RepID=A0ABD2CR29_VESMC
MAAWLLDRLKSRPSGRSSSKRSGHPYAYLANTSKPMMIMIMIEFENCVIIVEKKELDEGRKKRYVRRGDWSRERPGVGCAISPAGDMWSGQQVISITCKYAWTVLVCDTCIYRTMYHGHSRTPSGTHVERLYHRFRIQRITRKEEEDRLVTLSISCLTKPDVTGRGRSRDDSTLFTKRRFTDDELMASKH